MATRSPALTPRSVSAAASFTTCAVQLEVRERAGVARLALPDERGLGAVRGAQVTVEAALGDVEPGADEELRGWQLPLLEHRPRRAPNEVRRVLAPELLGLLERLAVHRGVGGVGADAGAVRERLAGGKRRSSLLWDSMWSERSGRSAMVRRMVVGRRCVRKCSERVDRHRRERVTPEHQWVRGGGCGSRTCRSVRRPGRSGSDRGGRRTGRGRRARHRGPCGTEPGVIPSDPDLCHSHRDRWPSGQDPGPSHPDRSRSDRGRRATGADSARYRPRSARHRRGPEGHRPWSERQRPGWERQQEGPERHRDPSVRLRPGRRCLLMQQHAELRGQHSRAITPAGSAVPAARPRGPRSSPRSRGSMPVRLSEQDRVVCGAGRATQAGWARRRGSRVRGARTSALRCAKRDAPRAELATLLAKIGHAILGERPRGLRSSSCSSRRWPLLSWQHRHAPLGAFRACRSAGCALWMANAPTGVGVF